MADKVKFDRFQDVETYLKTGKYSENRNENKKERYGIWQRNLQSKAFAITRMLEGYLCAALHRPKAHKDIYYITDVLFPEAVIFAIQQLGGLTRDEAEELFRNYVPHSQD